MNRLRDRADFVHEVVVQVQATGGVDDDGVPAGQPRLRDAFAGHLHRVGAIAGVEDRNSDLPSERLQLGDGRRTGEVGRHEKRISSPPLQVERELPRGGRLARALQADHLDDRGPPFQAQFFLLPAEQAHELVPDDPRDLLGGRQLLHHLGAHGLLPHSRGEVPHDREGDVGLQEGQADLAERRVEVVLGQVPLALQLLEDPLDPISQRLEHVGLR